MVRQRFLIPPPVGSNPAAPTNPRRILSAYFVVHRTLKAQCIKIHFREEILDLLEFCLWINASSFFSKKIRDWDGVTWRRRFSQSKFHFDFEDDLPLG